MSALPSQTIQVPNSLQTNNATYTFTLKGPDPQNLSKSVDTLLDSLALILEKHLPKEDELSNRLHEWGVYTIAWIEDTETESKLRELATKNLLPFQKTLKKTQVQMLARDAKIETDDSIHEFAEDVVVWIKFARKIVLSGNTPSEYSLDDVNLAILDPQIAQIMYTTLMSQIENINYQKSLIESIQTETKGLDEYVQFIKAEVIKGKQALNASFAEHERVIEERIASIEARHRKELEYLSLQITASEYEQYLIKNQIDELKDENTTQSRKILQLIADNQALKETVREIGDQASSSRRGCVIS